MSLKKRAVTKKAARPQAAAPEPTQSKKPELFVKLLKGTQVQDPKSKEYYYLGRLVPVKEITPWARRQCDHYGLLEIIE